MCENKTEDNSWKRERKKTAHWNNNFTKNFVFKRSMKGCKAFA